MRGPRSTQILIASGLFTIVLFLLFLLHGAVFSARWRSLRDGMTQEEVKQTLGVPTGAWNTEWTGSGDKKVIRWEYRRYQLGGWVSYYVDFDYIGPAGAPAVYKTERDKQEQRWPSW